MPSAISFTLRLLGHEDEKECKSLPQYLVSFSFLSFLPSACSVTLRLVLQAGSVFCNSKKSHAVYLLSLYFCLPVAYFPCMAKQCLISYSSQAHLTLFDTSSVLLCLIFLPLLPPSRSCFLTSLQ